MTSPQHSDSQIHPNASANELFTAACARVLACGRPTAPRGLPTREVLGSSLRLTDPHDRFVDLPPHRVLNPAFAVAEALWILSGSGEPWIHDFNSSLAAYVGHGPPRGAYGPRLRSWMGIDQFDQVRRLLLDDPDTRRAVLTIFDPARDLADERDIPCTLGHRFFLRDGRLHMVTSMRSQDVWRGLPYDLFTATLLLELMAGWIGADTGHWHHEVDSLHLYEPEHDSARQTGRWHGPTAAPMAPLAVGWESFDALLAQVIAGRRVGEAAWDDLADVMASFRLWRRGDRDAARERAGGPGPMSAALTRWFALRLARATRAS
ncbi:thymidylate synthase [Thermomonospora umbrina]|uniref:Thymidylate synthase n=1 Tax=Thermomonospora umbrina TaxID=111806 RepID=A0A3D9T136_9ACTN|nr:thymidylate synthase [Thermomonospora umbrina]REF00531.1 thymidylate synthase [Thermomonospora umbrina]